MIKELNVLKNKVKSAIKYVVVATSLAIMTAPVNAANGVKSDSLVADGADIKKAIISALNLVMFFVAAGGFINIVLGVRNLAAGVSDEGGGQDQQKISKGKGQLFSGIVMVGAMGVCALLGVTPQDIVNKYFT